MEVIPYSFGGVPLLSLAGDFDHDAVSSFTEGVKETLGKDRSRLLLQLTDCPYIDSGGIGCLLSSLRKVRPHGWLGVVAPSRTSFVCSRSWALPSTPVFAYSPALTTFRPTPRSPAPTEHVSSS